MLKIRRSLTVLIKKNTIISKPGLENYGGAHENTPHWKKLTLIINYEPPKKTHLNFSFLQREIERRRNQPIRELQADMCSFAAPLRLVPHTLFPLTASHKELFKPWYRHRAGIHSHSERGVRGLGSERHPENTGKLTDLNRWPAFLTAEVRRWVTFSSFTAASPSGASIVSVL